MSLKTELDMDRRRWLGAAGVVAAATLCDVPARAAASDVSAFVARRPAGFVPLSVPGRVVRVSAKGDFASIMQKNELWPRPDVARRLLEKAMMELTGQGNLVAAMRKFIHPGDIVAIKPNGIAGKDNYAMAVNFELILPVVEAILRIGVPPKRITVYEQTTAFLQGCRVNVGQWRLPDGVRTAAHGGIQVRMPKVAIYSGIQTAFASPFTDATAVIDMTMIKDHSITGYTGALKNITHGTISNPHEHHANQGSPQIAVLYNHPIVTSRVRLHIVDAFKYMATGGPLDRGPSYRLAHGAVYVATDPVAMDRVGLELVEQERKRQGVPSLQALGRQPRYIRVAGELGLGIGDLSAIRLRSMEI